MNKGLINSVMILSYTVIIDFIGLSGKNGQHEHGQRGHGHAKIRQKAIKAENEEKITSPIL